MTFPKLPPERVNELIEILDERFTQLQPRDCSALMYALIELRELRSVVNGFVINEQHMDDPEMRPVRDQLFALANAALKRDAP